MHLPLSFHRAAISLKQLRTDDSFALNFLDLFGLSSVDEESTIGFAGFIGQALILFGFLSLLWGSLDVSTDLRTYLFLFGEFVGGIALATAYGFKLRKKPIPITNEILSAVLAISVGALLTIFQLFLIEFTPLTLYSESVNYQLWAIMLAPIAESLAFDIFIYHFFKLNSPEIDWKIIAIASNSAFALFHYFRYGISPTFWIIIIILVVSNTAFVWLYHVTRNATTPILAHAIVNYATSPSAVLAALEGFLYLFLGVFVIVIIVYLFTGGRFK